jgi:ketosteroid isomerase-like protein
MSTLTAPTALVERWLELAADPDADSEEIAALLHPDARFVEHPNLVNPHGQHRGLAEARAALERSRGLLARAAFEVHGHVADGDRVVTRATWTGTLAVDAGPLPAGTTLHAECSIHFAFRDGRIVHQENFDCYRPPRPEP